MTNNRVERVALPSDWATDDAAAESTLTELAHVTRAAVAASPDARAATLALWRFHDRWQELGGDGETADLVQAFLGDLARAAFGGDPDVLWEELAIGAPTLEPAPAAAVASAMAARLALAPTEASARLDAVVGVVRQQLRTTGEAALPGLGVLAVRRRHPRQETASDGTVTTSPRPVAVMLKPSRSQKDALSAGRPIAAGDLASSPLPGALATAAGLTPETASATVGACIDAIGAVLDAPARSLALDGLGMFALVTRRARTGADPKTGEPIVIPATRSVQFLASPALRLELGVASA